MIHSESELDFSFAINSVPDFDSISNSESESESDFSSVFVNLDICTFFLPYIYTLLNKLADDFFINSHKRINSYASNANIIHIFFWCIITQKKFFYRTAKLSYFSFQKFLFVNRLTMKFNT